MYAQNLYVYAQSTASFFQSLNTDDDQITDTARNNPKRLDCQTLQFVLMFKFNAPASALWH